MSESYQQLPKNGFDFFYIFMREIIFANTLKQK